MKSWSQNLCGLTLLACAGCAGTIDDPASFEAYASESRGTAREAGVSPVDAQIDAATPEPVEEDDAAAPVEEPEPPPEPDAGAPADTGTVNPAPMVSCDFKALMMTKCGNPSCHGGPTASTGLDLTSDDLRGRVANVNGSGACNDKPLIDSADPEQSSLYLVVTGNACGLRMPLGGQLSAAEQACVLEWIKAAP
jgi:hypothetical protein